MGITICRQGGNIRAGEMQVFYIADNYDGDETLFRLMEDYLTNGIWVEVLEYIPRPAKDFSVSRRMLMWDKLLGITD